jgi:hypothetical protein
MMIDTSSKKKVVEEFKVPDIPKKFGGEKSLEEMFERMEIKVVGRENEEVKSQALYGGPKQDFIEASEIH